MRDFDPLLRWQENPFYLLGLEPTATELQTEREGRKLLAQLELGIASVRFARTPLGPVERSAELVRSALSELRDPERRRLHALWARLPVAEGADDPGAKDGARDARAPWDAMRALGWLGL
jgi:hypothetical protein